MPIVSNGYAEPLARMSRNEFTLALIAVYPCDESVRARSFRLAVGLRRVHAAGVAPDVEKRPEAATHAGPRGRLGP